MEHGKWKVCNLTDVFTNTHPLGKGDIHICDCNVHRKILETDVELPLEQAEANARCICRCVNAHDKLLEACKKTLEALNNMTSEQFSHGADKCCRDILEQAIAEAKDNRD